MEGAAKRELEGYQDQVTNSQKRLDDGKGKEVMLQPESRRQAQVDLENAVRQYYPQPPFVLRRTREPSMIRVALLSDEKSYEVSNMNLAGFPGVTKERKQAYNKAYQHVRDLAVKAGMKIATGTGRHPPYQKYELIVFVPAHEMDAHRALLNAVSEFQLVVDEGISKGYLEVLVPYDRSLKALRGDPCYMIAAKDSNEAALDFLRRLKDLSGIVKVDGLYDGVFANFVSYVRRFQNKEHMVIPHILASKLMLQERKLGTADDFMSPEERKLQAMDPATRQQELDKRIATIENSPNHKHY